MRRILKTFLRRKMLMVFTFELLLIFGLCLTATQAKSYQPAEVIELTNLPSSVYFSHMSWNGNNFVFIQPKYDNGHKFYIVEMDSNGNIISNNSIPLEGVEWIDGFYATPDNYYALYTNSTKNLIEIVKFSRDLQIIDRYNITSILGKMVKVSTLTVHENIYWVVETNFEKKEAYILSLDLAQNELISNITITPPANVAVYEYYALGTTFSRDTLWVLDSTNRVIRVFSNGTTKVSMNFTESIESYSVEKNITDIYPIGIAASEDVLWIPSLYFNESSQSENFVIFGFDLNEIAPISISEITGTTVSTATQSAVGGLVAAATTTIAVSSVSTVATSSVSTTSATMITTGASSGAQTAKENILSQLKNLFSLRKLKNLLKRKKKEEEEKEELTKPNFALATGVITLVGAIVGALIAVAIYGFGDINALLSGIATGVGLPLSIFGIITGSFTLSLIIRKKITVGTFTKIATIVSVIASIYGLITAPLALATLFPVEITTVYGSFAVIFAGYLAVTQISDFIRLISSFLSR